MISVVLFILIVGADAHLITSDSDDSLNYVTQKQFLSYTQTSYTVSSSEGTGNPFPNSQSVPEPTNLPRTISLSKTNTIAETSNSPSSLGKTVKFDSENVATPPDAKIDDRIINSDSINSEIPLKTTTFTSTTLSVANLCDTDQLVISDKPVQLHAYTEARKCSILVTSENSAAISVTLFKSDISNVYTYFYIERLESPTQMCPARYLLIGNHTPCKVMIPGNQFRLHFQNTEMILEIRAENVQLSCNDTKVPQVEFERCNVTSYESEIQWSEESQSFQYGYWWWRTLHITVNVVRNHFVSSYHCPDTCICTLGYREWLSTCIDSKGSDATRAGLILYNPSAQGLSFANSCIHKIQQHTFLGLEDLKVLILSHNVLTILPPTVCQNLPLLKILKLDVNRLANITSDVFNGRCGKQLLMLNLSNNELTNLPHDLFKKTNKLRTLDLKQNRLIQLYNDSLASLVELEILYLNDNELPTLPAGVFASLYWLRTLDLSGNAIATLPHDVFASLDWLVTLDLSGNAISILPHDVFDLLGWLDILDLSGNDIFTLPHDVLASQGCLFHLDLSDNAFSTLPNDMFAPLGELQTLDLSENAIYTLQNNVFASLYWLHKLDLSGNDISNLPHYVFASLGLLDTLNLSGNTISILPQGVFASQYSLNTLDLSGNDIYTLPHGVFATLGNLLYTLDLSGNAILTLPHDVFASLHELKSLDISHNNISHILSGSEFQDFINIITLDLSHSAINALPRDIFQSQRNLLTLDLSHNNIAILPGEVFENLTKLKVLKLDGNHNLTLCSSNEIFYSMTNLTILGVSKNSIKRFPLYLFRFTENLRSFDVSQNELESIPDQCFANLSNLINLNMSRNFLSQLPSFKAQKQLQVLDLSENRIRTLSHAVFNEIHNLKFLSLSKNNLLTISSQTFYHLHNLAFINISHNAIAKIGSRVFSNKIAYQSVDLRGNKMREVTSGSFKGTRNTSITVDKYATCCFIHKEQCISVEPRSEYLTCSRMLQNVFLRISVWIFGISAFTCNIIAYCVRSNKKGSNKVQTLLISHLALSDLLMGVNMLLLAVGDVYYGEYFPSYSHTWRQGFACKLAGFLSILSSEGSVFFITLISIDRLLGIKYPFGDHMLTKNMARICVLLTWLAAFLISAIPIGLATNRSDVFAISEVCIGIPIVRRNVRALQNNSVSIFTPRVSSSHMYENYYDMAWIHSSYVYGKLRNVNVKQQQFIQNITYTTSQNAGSQVASIYSIVVFICVNLLCFLTVAFCYIYIFITAKKTSKNATRLQDQKDEVRMAKKMFAIVFTDFCCWVPLGFMCILAQCGVYEISPEMYAWTVGFILPINSSVNPFLYVLYETMSNHLKKRQKERKARETSEMKARWKPVILFGTRFDQNWSHKHETNM